MRKEEARIIEGLGSALGLDNASGFEILKTAAEALGCIVDKDGTTSVPGVGEDVEGSNDGDDDSGDELEPEPKRRKGSAAAAAGENGTHGDDEEFDSEGSKSEEHSSDESDDDDEDIGIQPPVILEDPRTGEDVAAPESSDDPDAFMEWLLSPMELASFMSHCLERRVVLLSRPHNQEYYTSLFSLAELRTVLQAGLKYTYMVDVTRYEEGKRHTMNYNTAAAPEVPDSSEMDESSAEVADAHVVLRRFEEEGCSVRVLHPQRFSDALWQLLSKLETFWQCCVGCNAYLTPPASQGFAPHWDDIDAFVLQVEGQKRWRIYAPTDPAHVLPQHSSRDFDREELGEVLLEVVLEPGDLLYLPRGTVHEAEALPDSHSLHLTVSVNQQRTWRNLLELVLPQAIKSVAQNNVKLRSSVPPEFLLALGSAPPLSLVPEEQQGAAADVALEARERVNAHMLECLQAVMKSVDLDWAADQWGQDFMLQRLPPCPATTDPGADGSSGSGQLNKASYVQVAHPGASRLVIDEDGVEPVALVCHCLSNPRAAHAAGEGGCGVQPDSDGQHAVPPQLEFPGECEDTLCDLLAAEECGVAVAELAPPEGAAGVTAVQVAQALVDAGLLQKVNKPR